MTTEALGRETTSACNGATTHFRIGFQLNSTANLRVFLLDDPEQANEDAAELFEGDDYTLSGDVHSTTAEIITAIAHPIGKFLRRWRDTSRAQVADFVTNDGFDTGKLEIALDRLSMVDEELGDDAERDSERAVRVQPGERLDPLAASAFRLGDMLGFNNVDGKTELLSYTALATLLAPILATLLPGVVQGNPGANVAAVGLFTGAPALNIPIGTDLVRTAGYSAAGKGVADYAYDAAVDAAYVIAHPRTSFRTANARGFKLAPGLLLAVEQTGALRDGVTDDYAAIQAAIDVRRSAGGGIVTFEHGGYRVDHTLFWDDAQVHLLGSGKNVQPGAGTRLKYPAGLTGGIRWQNGALGLGEGSSVQGLVVEGSGVIAVSDADAQLGIGGGILCQANSSRIRDVVSIGWEGNGAMVLTPFGGGVGLNANNCKIDGLHCWNNLKNGFVTYGTDSNNCLFGLIDCSHNGQFGAYENGQLGNTYLDLHTAGNGTGAVRIGDITRSNRITLYKETGTLLAVQIDAGGGGGNRIDMRLTEGDGVSNPVVQDNSGTGTNIWNFLCAQNEGRFGLGNNADGSVVCDDVGVAIHKGGDLVQFNDDETVVWETYITPGGDRWVICNSNHELWTVVNAQLAYRADAAGLNLGGGKALRVDSVQVVGARQGAVAAVAPAAGDPPTGGEFNALVAAFNDLTGKLHNHGLIG